MIIGSWQNMELISFVLTVVWSLTFIDKLSLIEMLRASVERRKGGVGGIVIDAGWQEEVQKDPRFFLRLEQTGL